MTLTQMRYYEAVCRHMSLTKAARELHISQPALSMAMREIEHQCNVELFRHGANSLSITEQGEVLYREIHALLRRYENLEYMISHDMLGRNFVRVGYGVLSSSAFLPTIVRHFRHSHPDIQLFFNEGPATEIIELLNGGKLDVIIVNEYQIHRELGQADPGKYACVPLSSMRMLFAVNAENPLARQGAASWEDIVREPLILMGAPSKMAADIRRSLNAAGYDLPNNVYLTSQIHTILRFVEENAAASFIPSTGARDNPRIALLDYPGSYTTHVMLIYRRDSTHIDAVRQFIEITQGLFARHEV